MIPVQNVSVPAVSMALSQSRQRPGRRVAVTADGTAIMSWPPEAAPNPTGPERPERLGALGRGGGRGGKSHQRASYWLGYEGLCGASPEAEMTESRAQRPTIVQIEDRVSVVKQLRERFKEDKVYLRTLDADLLCLQVTLNWRRGEQKS